MTNDLLITLVLLAALILLAQFTHLILAGHHNRRLARELIGLKDVLEARHTFQVRLHREAKAAEQLVPDALAWAAAQVNAAGEMAGMPVTLTVIQRTVVDVAAVELLAEDGRRVVVTPLTASELRQAQRPGHGRLARALDNPLLDGARGVFSFERSLLNAGDYFDLEAAQAGRLFNIPGWQVAPRLWFHVLPVRTGETK
jgi:hypothetical protein